MGENIGMHSGAAALDQHRDHIGGLEKACIIILAFSRLGQQRLIGLRDFGGGCPRRGGGEDQGQK